MGIRGVERLGQVLGLFHVWNQVKVYRGPPTKFLHGVWRGLLISNGSDWDTRSGTTLEGLGRQLGHDLKTLEIRAPSRVVPFEHPPLNPKAKP